MELFQDVAKIAQLLWPLIASVLTLIGLGFLFMARKVLVFREEMYDRQGKRIYCTLEELNDWGKRVNVTDRQSASANQRSLSNERKIEIMQERDRHMMERMANEIVAPLKQITTDLREHGLMIAEIRERIGRIEGERRRNS